MATSATVTAKFSLFDDQPDSGREIVWSLRNVDGDWKVSDIEVEDRRLEAQRIRVQMS